MIFFVMHVFVVGGGGGGARMHAIMYMYVLMGLCVFMC